MKTKFICLAQANIKETLTVKDSLVDITIDPIMKPGAKLHTSGEVLVFGSVDSLPTEGELASLVQEYFKRFVPFSKIRKTEIRFPVKLSVVKAA